jgi:Mce-associated membrane protein
VGLGVPTREPAHLEDEHAGEKDAEDEGDPAAPPEAAEHAGSVSRAWWTVAAVLAVAALVLGAVLLLRDTDDKDRRGEVTQTAERFALALSSYDYRHISRDLAAVRAMGVGNFRYQYDEVLGGDAFRKALTDNEAVATAKVEKGPYLDELDDDEARTFTVLEQSVRGKGQTTPQARRVRVESILVRTVRGWRIDWVEIT